MVRFHTRLQKFYNGETGKHSGQGLKEYVYCKTKMPKGPKPPQSSIGSIPIYSSLIGSLTHWESASSTWKK